MVHSSCFCRKLNKTFIITDQWCTYHKNKNKTVNRDKIYYELSSTNHLLEKEYNNNSNKN